METTIQRVHPTLKMVVAALMMVCLLSLAVLPFSSSAQANSTIHGCPSGYACIYGDATGNSDTPTHKFYYYGVYKLSNQFDRHTVFNNQTDGAVVMLCTDWSGNTCPYTVTPGGWGVSYDLTPINSVRVSTRVISV